ncbi:MAG: class I adenylate-forming enzyme family protein [Ferroplasma sp.]
MLDFNKGAVTIPEISVYSLFARNAEVNRSYPAIIFYDKYITYSRTMSFIDSMAYELKHGYNVRPGDTVIVSIELSPQYIISIFAILKIGARAFILKGSEDTGIIRGYIKKYGIKIVIVSKNSLDNFYTENATYIISDSSDFLTLGKAIINRFKNHRRINYNNHVVKFYKFLYNDKSDPEESDLMCPKILIKDGSNILAFTEKNLLTSTFIINYWLPKLDKKPAFYSSLPSNTATGLLYSVLIPVSYSGTVIINDRNRIFGNNSPDFIAGSREFYIDSIKYNFGNYKHYKNIHCLMPFYNKDIAEKFEEINSCKIIGGFSTECTLTSHLNPFDDIRAGSFGIPLNYVEFKIMENKMLIKGPQNPEYMLTDTYIKNDEWYNTGIAVDIKDGYFYEL